MSEVFPVRDTTGTPMYVTDSDQANVMSTLSEIVNR